MMLAVNEGEMQFPERALGHKQKTSMRTDLISQKKKNDWNERPNTLNPVDNASRFDDCKHCKGLKLWDN